MSLLQLGEGPGNDVAGGGSAHHESRHLLQPPVPVVPVFGLALDGGLRLPDQLRFSVHVALLVVPNIRLPTKTRLFLTVTKLGIFVTPRPITYLEAAPA